MKVLQTEAGKVSLQELSEEILLDIMRGMVKAVKETQEQSQGVQGFMGTWKSRSTREMGEILWGEKFSLLLEELARRGVDTSSVLGDSQ